MEKTLSCAGRKQDLHAYDERLDERQTEEDDRRDVERMGLVLADAGVHRVTDQRRSCERDQRGERHRGAGDEIERPHGPQKHPRVLPDRPRRRFFH
ncbi:MAG: hypothetical protein E6G33_02400 [Actinobacteria bacterium]|nr:MAG: hypothetical protein E6G33_02400 [Actinomycetota bacterium]